MNHQSQDDLLKSLFAIFPTFEEEWAADQSCEAGPNTSLHSVYQSLLPYVSGASASQDQLQRLAILVNSAVAAGGDSENAVSTCFLEHVGQVALTRSLRPLLSAESRSRLRA